MYLSQLPNDHRQEKVFSLRSFSTTRTKRMSIYVFRTNLVHCLMRVCIQAGQRFEGLVIRGLGFLST